jgi:hypothetical protein
VLDITEGGARGGAGFKFEFAVGVVSLIPPSSFGRRRTLDFSDNFVGGSST